MKVPDRACRSKEAEDRLAEIAERIRRLDRVRDLVQDILANSHTRFSLLPCMDESTRAAIRLQDLL